MRAGQTSTGNNGLQNSLFPLPYMEISQGSGGGYSHDGKYAIDFRGWGANGRIYKAPYYAPFDCTCTSKDDSLAYIVWTSDKEVNYPTGKGRLSIAVIHDDNTESINVGDKRNQGNLLGHTGTSGNVTGDHVHIEMFKVGQEFVYPEGMLKLENTLFIDNTVLINDGGYNWVKSGDSIITITPICGNRYLTMEEMKNNAQYIAYYLINKGWTSNAIAGMLGNMETESTINPCIWQSLNSYSDTPYITVQGAGFGLVQWTPFNKYTVWARDSGLQYNTMDANLQRITYEVANGIQWISTSNFPLSFKSFSTSNETPEYLAYAFITNYERPADPNQPARQTQARYWFDNLDWLGNSGGDSNNKKDSIFHLLLSDALNGWKW